MPSFENKEHGGPMVEGSQNNLQLPMQREVQLEDGVAKCTPSVSEYLKESLTTLLTLFSLHGYKSDTGLPVNTLRHWELSVCAMGGTMKCAMSFMKWKTAAFFSYWNGQKLPALPKGLNGSSTEHAAAIIGGKAHRWVRLLKVKAGESHDDAVKFFNFTTGVLYSKKGMPRPDKSTVKAGERSTFESLTGKLEANLPVRLPQPLLWSDLDDLKAGDLRLQKDVHPGFMNLTREKMVQQIFRTVHEIFDGYRYRFEDRVVPFFPSTSANYIRSRSGGGAVSALLEEHKALFSDLSSDGGVRFAEASALGNEEQGENGRVLAFDDSRLTEDFAKFYIRALRAASLEENIATPLGLAEALKVRVITKGPPLRMTVLKPLQRFMRRVLSKLRVFQLVGRTVNERILFDSLGRLRKDEMWLSGDYSAATDKMQSWASEAAATAISDVLNLSSVERKLFVEALTKHTLEYEGEQRPQTTGQLMGSVVSFPVLCIVNAAVCRYAMEISQNQILPLRARRCRLLINGDDCLFPISDRGRVIWEKVALFVGLEPSLGKYYHSRKFANINSTNFHYDELRTRAEDWQINNLSHFGPTAEPPSVHELSVVRHNPFTLARYVNLGLIFGLKRSGGSVSESDAFSQYGNLGSRHRELHRLTPDWLWPACHRLFVQYHESTLEALRPLPWYLPEWIGGLGMVGVPSELDCQLAYALLRDWKSLGFRGTPRRETAKASWKVRKIIEASLNRYSHLVRPLTTTEADHEESFKSELAVSLLFRGGSFNKDDAAVHEAAGLEYASLSWKDLYSDPEGSSLAVANHNKKIWSSRLHKGKLLSLPGFGNDVAIPATGKEKVAMFLARLSKARPRVGIPVIRQHIARVQDQGEHEIDYVRRERIRREEIQCDFLHNWWLQAKVLPGEDLRGYIEERKYGAVLSPLGAGSALTRDDQLQTVADVLQTIIIDSFGFFLEERGMTMHRTSDYLREPDSVNLLIRHVQNLLQEWRSRSEFFSDYFSRFQLALSPTSWLRQQITLSKELRAVVPSASSSRPSTTDPETLRKRESERREYLARMMNPTRAEMKQN
jgi:hypothetical protein